MPTIIIVITSKSPLYIFFAGCRCAFTLAVFNVLCQILFMVVKQRPVARHIYHRSTITTHKRTIIRALTQNLTKVLGVVYTYLAKPSSSTSTSYHKQGSSFPNHVFQLQETSHQKTSKFKPNFSTTVICPLSVPSGVPCTFIPSQK